jgi:hypothetical protein
MNFKQFCLDRGIPFVTEGHKHSRPGWVQVECPFCSGNPGYHLGHNEKDDFFNCWRCEWHGHVEVVKTLLKCSTGQALDLIKQYGGFKKGHEF